GGEGVLRGAGLALSFLRRCVPRPDADPDEWFGLALFLRQLCQFAEWLFKIAVDVVRERLQRRDVQAVDPVLEFPTKLLRVQLVDDRHESRERLADPGR